MLRRTFSERGSLGTAGQKRRFLAVPSLCSGEDNDVRVVIASDFTGVSFILILILRTHRRTSVSVRPVSPVNRSFRKPTSYGSLSFPDKTASYPSYPGRQFWAVLRMIPSSPPVAALRSGSSPTEKLSGMQFPVSKCEARRLCSRYSEFYSCVPPGEFKSSSTAASIGSTLY